MDVAIELFDTFVGDHVFAALFPAKPAPYDFPQATNASLHTFSSWEYKPATYLWSIKPHDAAYMSAYPRDNLYRQMFSIWLIVWIFGLITYFVFASLSYVFVFDKKIMDHPKYLKNQVWLEIKQSSSSMPVMSLYMLPFFLIEVRGHTKLFDHPSEAPFPLYNWLQFPLFLLFTDFCIYWIHRGLHHPLVYKRLHKPHHRWIMPTPYAAYAFHPIDGWAQGVPYHIFPLLFPLNKVVYILSFIFINFWTILIHDGEYVANNPIINGAACHAVHHIAFNYNYGQYTTLWDRIGGSYRRPDDDLFNKETKFSQNQFKKQSKEMERMVKEVEGSDDRVYEPEEPKKTK